MQLNLGIRKYTMSPWRWKEKEIYVKRNWINDRIMSKRKEKTDAIVRFQSVIEIEYNVVWMHQRERVKEMNSCTHTHTHRRREKAERWQETKDAIRVCQVKAEGGTTATWKLMMIYATWSRRNVVEWFSWQGKMTVIVWKYRKSTHKKTEIRWATRSVHSVSSHVETLHYYFQNLVVPAMGIKYSKVLSNIQKNIHGSDEDN